MWEVDLDPTVGHEMGARRPAVVVSADRFSNGAAQLVMVCPITRTDRRIPLHYKVDPPEGGLRARSFVLCDQLRTISVSRLRERRGSLSASSIAEIEDRLRVLSQL